MQQVLAGGEPFPLFLWKYSYSNSQSSATSQTARGTPAVMQAYSHFKAEGTD